jgi:hypothetical protein
MDNIIHLLSEKYKHRELEILRTLVPRESLENQGKIYRDFYLKFQEKKSETETRWVIRAGTETFMGTTFGEVAEKALGSAFE